MSVFYMTAGNTHKKCIFCNRESNGYNINGECILCFKKNPNIDTNKSEGKRGNKNPMWKGDDVGIIALHRWGHRNILRPKLCQDCKKISPYDLANISQNYKREISDWEWLCRRCHMKKDGRLKNVIERLSSRKWNHGSTAGYNRYKCRCELCIKAYKEYYLKNRDKILRRDKERREKLNYQKLSSFKKEMK